MAKLSKALLKNITENNLSRVQHYCKTLDPKWDDEYVTLASQLGHSECLKMMTDRNWPGVWSGSGLNKSVECFHNECIKILFDQTSTAGKYKAFATALKINNDDFLQLFIPTIPSFSINWLSVFGALVEHHRLDLVEICLENCNWSKVVERIKSTEDAQLTHVLDEVNNYRVNKKIAANIEHAAARVPTARKI